MIRKARREDIPDILEIEYQSFRYPWTRTIFDSCIGSDGFLVFSNEKVIAYAMVRVEFGKAHLESIAVLPIYRRKGIGSGLLDACMEYAAAMGARIMELEVRESNAGAVAFYSKHGFEIAAMAKHYYITENAIIMVKRAIGVFTEG